MKFLVISGLSGAGKSRTAAVLEDLGFYCVDNMPVVLMPKFAQLGIETRGRYDRVALVTDIRGREGFDELFAALDKMRDMGCDYEILFIEASEETIIRRYKETRRRHPLDVGGISMETAIRREKRVLASLRERADYIIDTSNYTLAQLQDHLYKLFSGKNQERSINVSVMSFGFKYGLPKEADLVFDVRFLRNPYYIPELKEKTGLDSDVREYIFQSPQTAEFMGLLKSMISFLLPQYVEEGKQYLCIAIGCTGGHHRSVALAQELAEFVKESGYSSEVLHRDMEK